MSDPNHTQVPKMHYCSDSPSTTEAFAQHLACHLTAGDVLSLDGELGAGKTTFTRGLARGLNCTGDVTSPTFTLLLEHEEHHQKYPLYHFDAYRLQDSEDFSAIGLDEYFSRRGICVVEWGRRIQDVLPRQTLFISFFHDDPNAPNRRRIELVWPQSEKRLQALKKSFAARKDETT